MGNLSCVQNHQDFTENGGSALLAMLKARGNLKDHLVGTNDDGNHKPRESEIWEVSYSE